MKEHREHGHIDTESVSEAVDRLEEFYTHNGYEVAEDELTQPDLARFVRGEEGVGWWSSNMTDLYARVTLRESGGGIDIDYLIDVSGQHLTEGDHAFWDRELDEAVRFARGDVSEPKDLRRAEEKRTDEGFESRMSTAIMAVIILAVFFAVLAFLGVI